MEQRIISPSLLGGAPVRKEAVAGWKAALLERGYAITATAGKGGSIAPSGTVVVEEGQDQAFVITPDFGYTIDTLYVDGKAVEATRTYAFPAVDKNHTIHATFQFVTLPIIPEAPDSGVGDWLNTADHMAYLHGYPDGTFRPNAPITRAEVAAVVNRMLQRQADEAYLAAHGDDLRQFSDLSTTYWAYETIMEAANGHTYVAGASGEVWTNLR